MRLTIACVGRPSGWAALASDDYLSRIRRYLPAEMTPARAERDADKEPLVAKKREGERLLGAVPRGAVIVALDPTGKQLDSPGLAKLLGKHQDGGVRELAFLVGGSVGLSDEVREKCQLLLSLSPMTLPHELALVVLCEQLYRACSILRGERYHK